MLRSLLFQAYFIGLTVVMGLIGIPVRRFLPPDRVLAFAQSWVRFSLAGLYRICGIRLSVEGRENLPDAGPALIASQHQSAFDTLVWHVLVPRPVYVMKRELARIPLLGPMLLATGNIAVDRAAGAAALRSLVREAGRAAAEGRQIIIFPEGTRVAPGQEVALQPGVAALAASTGLPVIPVVTDSGRRWPRRGFRTRPGVIHIRILPPLPAGLKRSEIMERLQGAWREGWRALAEGTGEVPATIVDNSVG